MPAGEYVSHLEHVPWGTFDPTIRGEDKLNAFSPCHCLRQRRELSLHQFVVAGANFMDAQNESTRVTVQGAESIWPALRAARQPHEHGLIRALHCCAAASWDLGEAFFAECTVCESTGGISEQSSQTSGLVMGTPESFMQGHLARLRWSTPMCLSAAWHRVAARPNGFARRRDRKALPKRVAARPRTLKSRF